MLGSAAVEPPPFQEAARCVVCFCSFNAFRRRHHCRCCGRTLCYEHSSNQMALPQYGIYTNVRVCSDCFNSPISQRRERDDSTNTPNLVADTRDSLSSLDISDTEILFKKKISDTEINSKSGKKTMEASNPVVPECKCGMPLCICAAVLPDPVPEVKMSNAPPPRSNPRPVKANNTQKTVDSLSRNVASSSSKPSVFFNMGQQTSNREQDRGKYEGNGEGLREAIKYGDSAAVKRLLEEGVDSNYRDKQGLSLLHLAALFNQTEIALILMEHGASLEYKNSQGETPLDCAPTMLQFKMRQKMDAGP